MSLPANVIAEVQRLLEQEARRALDKHLAECFDADGTEHLTPKPDEPGAFTCDRCGDTLYKGRTA